MVDLGCAAGEGAAPGSDWLPPTSVDSSRVRSTEDLGTESALELSGAQNKTGIASKAKIILIQRRISSAPLVPSRKL